MAFREIINQMIDHLGGPPPPGPVSEAMLDGFKQAIDLANECRGDPRVLFRALQAFAATGNEALFAAGVAYVQYHGAYIQGITYDRDGMEVAGAWLMRAEAQDAGIVEFSVIRAFIEIHSRELAGIAELLEDVRQRDSVNYYALTAELEYYAVLGKLDQMMATFQRAAARPFSHAPRLSLSPDRPLQSVP